MKVGRFLSVGLMLAIGGCAGESKPSATIEKPKPAVSPATEEPKWEAAGSPLPDSLAQKTNDYAANMERSDPDAAAKQPRASQAKFLDRLGQPKPVDEVPPVTPALAVAANPAKEVRPAIPADAIPSVQLASAKTVVRPIPVTDDGPKTLPESADFDQSPAAGPNDTLEGRLYKRTRENPGDIADQLDLQLYAMLNNQPPAELAAATGLPSEDTELVDALVDGLRNFRSTVRQGQKMLQAEKIKPLLEMADRVRSQAGLSIHGLTLCRRVDGFGKYDPISPAHFAAGKENAAIVYCEVENFLPLQNSQGLWETKLSEQVTLYSEMGVPIWSDAARTVKDQCRNRRHDFFAYIIIKLPATLAIGRYTLNVSIEDQNANRVDEAKVPLWLTDK